MMKKKLAALLAVLLLAVPLLSACGTASESQPAENAAPKETQGQAAESGAAAEPPAPYAPTEEERLAYTGTWVYTDHTVPGERVYRLTVSEEGWAELVTQNGVGSLLALLHGGWTVSGESELTLRLTEDMRDGEPVETDEGDRKEIGGRYAAVPGEEYTLTLTPEMGAELLIPGMAAGSLTLYDERYTPEVLETLCRAVRNYVEATAGTAYPGEVQISEIGPEGVLLQVFEDMGDHIATAGWYLVDPVTFEGSDEVLCVSIDFAPYQ